MYSSSRHQINLIIILDEDKLTRRSKRIIGKIRNVVVISMLQIKVLYEMIIHIFLFIPQC